MRISTLPSSLLVSKAFIYTWDLQMKLVEYMLFSCSIMGWPKSNTWWKLLKIELLRNEYAWKFIGFSRGLSTVNTAASKISLLYYCWRNVITDLELKVTLWNYNSIGHLENALILVYSEIKSILQSVDFGNGLNAFGYIVYKICATGSFLYFCFFVWWLKSITCVGTWQCLPYGKHPEVYTMAAV